MKNTKKYCSNNCLKHPLYCNKVAFARRAQGAQGQYILFSNSYPTIYGQIWKSLIFQRWVAIWEKLPLTVRILRTHGI